MTTMPPEMSTAAAPNHHHHHHHHHHHASLTPNASVSRDSLSTLQASRSRFMITDILAGSAAAAVAAAALQHGGVHNNNNNGNSNNNGNNSTNVNSNGDRSASTSPQQSPQPTLPQSQSQPHPHPHPHVALQHYLAQQQQQLLQQQAHYPHQQQQQQQQQQHSLLAHQQQHAQTVATAPFPSQHHQQHHSHPHSLPHPHPHPPPHHPAHPLAHLPPSAALMGAFPAGATPTNGLHAAQAAAHYAALQRERDREQLRELDAEQCGRGGSALLDHDERSRSPLGDATAPVSAFGVRDLSGAASVGNMPHHSNSGGGSISGDQASTIDDSDSDTCGAKDDDGNSSIKSDNLMGLTKKQRKARTAFTDHQLQTLEKSFERQKYLSVQDRMELANKLELSDCQVKTWYQNRRTKWKRQTAVGLELLAEAGNYAAFQRLYGNSPYLSAWPYAAQVPHGAPASAIDLYYRQAAAAAVLQKPLSYRMYPSMPTMSGLPGMPMPTSPMAHLSATTSLSTLSGYYQPSGGATHPALSNSVSNNNNGSGPLPPLHAHSPVQSETSEQQHRSSVDYAVRTPSPQLNPGSPPERAEHNNQNRSPAAPSEEDTAEQEADEEEEDDDAIEV